MPRLRLKAEYLPRFVRRWFLHRKLRDVERLAAQVHDNKHFKQIILNVKPGMRRAVYEQLSPMLKFKPKPYILLIK